MVSDLGKQGSRGAEEQRGRGAEEQRSRGAEEQRSRGAREFVNSTLKTLICPIPHSQSPIPHSLCPYLLLIAELL
ncbi:hypothetical protein [Argonema galeatum]|uniref:hypothetical protein n=1 Tax=Argonema galeatum TaxID=2942762 RepID=UPI002011580F|nr:hypothetical protein [Argonema galeatum]MCL1465154.1 hypothetical protein [Argonema galeatum A003/A1]